MTYYLSILWELLVNISETIIVYFFINSVLTKTNVPHWQSKMTILLFARFLSITIGNAKGVTPFYTVLTAYLFNLFIAFTMFKEKNIIKFFWSSFHILLGLICEIVCFFLLNLFTGKFPNEMLYGENFRVPSTTMYLILFAGSSFLISSFRIKKLLFTLKQKLFFLFTMIMGILLTHCLMYIMMDLDKSQTTLLNITILADILFLCFFLALLAYMYQLAVKQQENDELQEHAKLLELETSQYNNLLSTTESLRVIKHDMHHHLATIRTLLETDNIEHIKQYLEEYQTHFHLNYMLSATGNIVIDSILSTKTLLAKQQNIRLDFSVMLPKRFPITDVTLSALLGNLFDNAFDACKRLPKEKRWITFQIKVQEDMLIIFLENSFDGVMNQDSSGTYISRKKEPHHGIGLKRIFTLVEEANGFTAIRHTDNTFSVHIMIPLENTNEI